MRWSGNLNPVRKQTILKDDGRYLIYYMFGEEDAALTPAATQPWLFPSPHQAGKGIRRSGEGVPAADSSLASRETPEPFEVGTPLPRLGEATAVRAAEEPGTGQEPEA
jgi:hypothetical protein